MSSMFAFTNLTARQIDELGTQLTTVIQHHGPDIFDDLSSNSIDRRSHSEHYDALSHGRKPLEIPETSKHKISPESDFKNL